MKKFEGKMLLKTKLALALSATLVGFGMMGQAQAVPALTADGLGDAALFPYYSAKPDWQTFIRVVNTSADAVAVKVRFREQANSRDVLDFIVLLSPYDMWSAWTDTNAAVGGTVPGIRTNDTSCIAPGINTTPISGEGFEWENQAKNLVSAAFKDRAYTGRYDDNGTGSFAGGSEARLSEGHIEVIGVASYAPTSNMGRWITHNQSTGKPDSCQSAINSLEFAKNNPNAAALLEANDVGDVLAANAYMINVRTGQGAGYNPTMIKGFQTVNLVSEAVDSRDLVGSGRKPDMNSADVTGMIDNSIVRGTELVQYLPVGTTAGSTGNVAPVGVDVISSILMRNSVINEWAAQPATPTKLFSKFTQWVLNFPTKNFYVDLQNDAVGSDDVSGTLTDPRARRGNSVDPGFIIGTDPNDAVAPFVDEFNADGGTKGRSCQPYRMDIWNTEEGRAGFTSPAPTFNGALCQETNVISFDRQFTTQGLNSATKLFVNQNAFPITPVVNGVNTGAKATSGWAKLNFISARAPKGLPVDGFMFTVYNTGASASNYTAIHDHKYEVAPTRMPQP